MSPARRIARRLADQRAVALPLALAVLAAVTGLAVVAARGAIVSSHQSLRDRNAKRAIQAAVSGLKDATYQTNLMQPGTSQCVTKNGTGGTLSNSGTQGDGWCAAQTEDLGDGATYTQRVSAATVVSVNGQSLARRAIVSTGTVNGVTRRATWLISASTGDPLFPPGFAIVTQDAITMKNNAKVIGGLGSNGDINLKNNTNVCGSITPGPGKTLYQGQNTTVCSGYSTAPATTQFSLQPVDQGTSRTSNDNIRITRAVLNQSGTKDTCSSCSKIAWDATTRVLKVNSGAVLTLGGDVYNFCRLEVNGGTIQIAVRTTPMRVYIDTPENCGGTSGMGSVALASGSQFVNLSNNPSTFVLLVAGSAKIATAVDLSSNDVAGSADVVMAIYAPNSTVTYANNLSFIGAIVAKSLSLKNNAKITLDSRVGNISSGSSTRFYQGESYRECTSAPTTTAPDSGC